VLTEFIFCFFSVCLFRNCLRRIARHDEQQFSKDSIVNVMEKFVKTVNIMDDTILVPCRLMDRQVGSPYPWWCKQILIQRKISLLIP